MAVAVKTPPGARGTGHPGSPAILSLVGVVYLLACLVIVFKLIPDLWWAGWHSAGLKPDSVVGGTLVALLGLACGVGLLMVGSRLLGSDPPVGVRAGVFVAFLGLLTAVLLTRWASLWIEHWAFTSRWFNETTGLILTCLVGIGFLVLWVRLFTRPSVQKWVLALEHAGWFHATSYKSNQGQKVRRGTIAGLLVVVGAGIYTLLTHNTLGRGSKDWTLNLPFTGNVAVSSFGDTQGFLAAEPDGVKSQVRITWPGKGKGFEKGQIISFEKYREAVAPLVQTEPDFPRDAEASAFMLAVNKRTFGARMEKLLETGFFPKGVEERLSVLMNQTPWEDLSEAIELFSSEGANVVKNNPEKENDLGIEFNFPAGVLLINRYKLRDINDKTEENKNVKIVLKGDSSFKEGEIVTRDAFDEEVSKLEELRKQGRDRVLPTRAALAPATGQVQAAGITLLPGVQYTLPLLLLAGSLWLAWRVVNMPAFADFLIATEAELNKVSWTTQKRLVQDTIVVLVTVVLMAVFLFCMDWAWKVILSSKPIGVLHIPKEESQQNKPFEQKRW